MFGHLTGKIIHKSAYQIILDVSGVGYEIYVTAKVAANTLNSTINLWISTKVSENDISLFGFEENDSKDFFDLLDTVSGIGSKTALQILDRLSTTDIQTAIFNDDVQKFMSVPGIGRKSASKIIIELKSKLSNKVVNMSKLSAEQQMNHELVEALKKLGYSQNEINQILPKLDLSESPDLLIKKAIKLL